MPGSHWNWSGGQPGRVPAAVTGVRGSRDPRDLPRPSLRGARAQGARGHQPMRAKGVCGEPIGTSETRCVCTRTRPDPPPPAHRSLTEAPGAAAPGEAAAAPGGAAAAPGRGAAAQGAAPCHGLHRQDTPPLPYTAGRALVGRMRTGRTSTNGVGGWAGRSRVPLRRPRPPALPSAPGVAAPQAARGRRRRCPPGPGLP